MTRALFVFLMACQLLAGCTKTYHIQTQSGAWVPCKYQPNNPASIQACEDMHVLASSNTPLARSAYQQMVVIEQSEARARVQTIAVEHAQAKDDELHRLGDKYEQVMASKTELEGRLAMASAQLAGTRKALKAARNPSEKLELQAKYASERAAYCTLERNMIAVLQQQDKALANIRCDENVAKKSEEDK